MRPVLLAAVLLVVFPAAARADFIGTVTLQGPAIGTFAGQPYTERTVTLQGIYHTDQIVMHSMFPPRVEWDVPVIVTVSIEGFGSATFLQPIMLASLSQHDFIHIPPSLLGLISQDPPFGH